MSKKSKYRPIASSWARQDENILPASKYFPTSRALLCPALPCPSLPFPLPPNCAKAKRCT